MHLPSSRAFRKELRNSAADSERDKGFVFWLRVSRIIKSEKHGLLVFTIIYLFCSLLFISITRDTKGKKKLSLSLYNILCSNSA